MTTLPPEGQDPQVPGNQPSNEPIASQPPAPPQFEPPAQQPQAPQYQQPQAPQYQQPTGGQVPPGGGYQQPGYAQQPIADPVNNITLNYWLSVFFTWIPALIFFLVEKDKGNRQAYEFHRDNLNFSLLRVAVSLVTFIPYIGWLVGVLGGIVLFVFHIMAAAKSAEAYRSGQKAPFIFNIPLIK